jgi:NAD(P)-dependent dehydrogenase (short-subunit alcohol dehydrogenase family)
MTGRLNGKVAFITGAARGQGRAHAIRMAQEGADIIAVDLCEQLESSTYALADLHDLSETERAVKELGRRIVARQADVRERAELREAIQAGLTDLGGLDIVVANAGVCLLGAKPSDISAFVDGTDILLIGVMNTIAAALPHIRDHGSIIIWVDSGNSRSRVVRIFDQPRPRRGRIQLVEANGCQLRLATSPPPRSAVYSGESHTSNKLQYLDTPQRPNVQGLPTRPRASHSRGCPTSLC